MHITNASLMHLVGETDYSNSNVTIAELKEVFNQIPDQNGHSGEVLTTDGETVSWAAPAQSAAVTYVDIPMPIITAGNFGYNATNYQPFASNFSCSQSGTAGADIDGAIGMEGTIVGFYFKTRINTLSLATGEFRLWVNNATTDVVIPVAPGAYSGSDTTHTQALVATDKVQIRWTCPNTGSGAIGTPMLTLILRKQLA